MLILLLVMSASFATDVPIEISGIDITYKMEGTIFVTLGPASSISVLEFNGSVIPQVEARNDELYGATLIYDELGNEILTREYHDVKSNINWDYYTQFKTRFNLQKLSSLASFPYEEYPTNVEKYLEFSKNSNINDDIRETASNVVQGSETVIQAALKLSEWVHNNIEYDSQFYGRNYDAETVFENKKGVCGEFSSLLISMLRSVGIPARYVPGYVYSNIPGYDGFGAHAWIEFYDPVTGWISTDPTFGEFGFIDGTHIKMKHDIDADEPITEGSASGFGSIAIDPKIPEHTISYSNTEEWEKILFTNVEVDNDFVGERDYVVIKVTITNPTKYFIPTTLSLIKTKESEIVYGYERMSLILNPDSDLEKYLILRTSDCDVLPKLLCVHPLSVQVTGSEIFKTNITIAQTNPLTSYEGALSKVKIQELNLKKNVEIKRAEIEPKVVYDETPTFYLDIKNKGNTILDLDLSIDNKNVDLGQFLINEEKSFSIPLSVPSQFGRVDVPYALTDDISENFTTSYIHAEKPVLSIEYLGSKDFKGMNPLNFTLIINKTGEIQHADVIINTNAGTMNKTIELDKINVYTTTIPAEYFPPGDSPLYLIITATDPYGKNSSFEKTFIINREVSGLSSISAWLTYFWLKITAIF